MSAADFLEYSISFSLVVLIISFLLAVVRVIVGPSLPDRVLALDLLVVIAIGFIAVIGVKTGIALYVDIAIALGLVGFLATVAFARLIVHVGQFERRNEEMQEAEEKKREAQSIAEKEQVS